MDQILFNGEMDGLSAEQVVRDAGFSMATRHFHATYEFYYLVEGERYYFVDNETYLVKAGDVMLIGPNHIHKTSQAGAARNNRILLQISGDMMNPFLKGCGLGSIETLFGGEVRTFSLTEEQRKVVEDTFGRLRKELEKKPRDYPAAVRLLLAELLLFLSRRLQPLESDTPRREPQTARTWKHQKVHEVADYLTIHPETDESLEELARRFYVSKSYLSRIFREVTGFTVNEYRNVSRIRKSQQLLRDGKLSVTEIAAQVGFENLTYYERVFKKYTDTTPLKYRKTFNILL